MDAATKCPTCQQKKGTAGEILELMATTFMQSVQMNLVIANIFFQSLGPSLHRDSTVLIKLMKRFNI